VIVLWNILLAPIKSWSCHPIGFTSSVACVAAEIFNGRISVACVAAETLFQFDYLLILPALRKSRCLQPF
jgi:hypothetical protein